MKGLIYIDKNRIEYAKVSRKGEKIQVLEGGVIHPDQTLDCLLYTSPLDTADR